MSTFEDCLQELDKLMEHTPEHILQANRHLVSSVCKKLSKRNSDSSSSLLEHLETTRDLIEKYSAQTVESAIRSPVNWGDVNLRVHDIRLGTKEQSSLMKFRKGLGERSLASQYHKWELEQYGSSRLDVLYRDPTACKDVADGKIPAFINAQALPTLECVVKGIRHGTKLLLLERLVGCPSISAMFFSSFRRLRALKYDVAEDVVSMSSHFMPLPSDFWEHFQADLFNSA